MSDATNIAGVVGTWVAVFIAIVALAAILPAYFLYKKSMTDKARALALVDDPSQIFISTGFHIPGTSIRVNRIIGVPDLRWSPNLRFLESLPDPSKLGPRRSTTSWVNFAQVMLASFPSMKTIAGEDALVFKDQQSYLLVHRNWILVLGVIHRYAFRQDYGLPLHVVPDAGIETQNWKQSISGLSGSVLYGKEITGSEEVRLFFEMHSLPVVLQALPRMKASSIQNLLLLMLGYISCPDGEYIIFNRAEGDHRSVSGRPTFEGRLRIAKVVSGEIDREDMRITKDFNLVLPIVKRLVFSQNRKDFPSGDNSTPTNLEEQDYHELGYWKSKSQLHTMIIWMERTEVQRIVLRYLMVETSPLGFLYDAPKDIFVQKVLQAAQIDRTLNLAKRVLNELTVTEDSKRRIQFALGAVQETDTVVTSWSRHAMQTFHALDQAIQAVCMTGSFMWKATATIFSYHAGFQAAICRSIERFGDDHSLMVRFDLANAHIAIPDPDYLGNTINYSFNFEHAFPNTEVPSNTISGELPLSQVAFAALQGHIRAKMWKMSLSPKGLLSLWNASHEAGGIFLLGTRSTRFRVTSPRRAEYRESTSVDSEDELSTLSDMSRESYSRESYDSRDQNSSPHYQRPQRDYLNSPIPSLFPVSSRRDFRDVDRARALLRELGQSDNHEPEYHWVLAPNRRRSIG